ncbi:MAG: cupin domain-containing protein [Erysipelotrichaceae bacterium]|nr:cupin domain-containing protein [Erysipelotrichaceae bacterium]
MANTPEWMCIYPYKKEEKRSCVMKQSELKKFLYTEETIETSDLNWLVASTDSMTVGEYQLAPGTHFAPADVHAGDEIYYVLKGQVTMFQPAMGQVVVVNEKEGILMPKGCPHIGYNFGETEARMLYVIAPKAWDENNEIPLEYTGDMKVYKYEERGN